MSLFRVNILLAFAAFLFPVVSYTSSDFVVQDIYIDGINKVDRSVIIEKLPFKIGEKISEQELSRTVNNLYDIGFFDDVSIKIENDIAIISVKEMPLLHSVEFHGVNNFSKEYMLNILNKFNFIEGSFLNLNSLNKIKNEIKLNYSAKGIHGIEISVDKKILSNELVDISFNIDEGPISKIRSIHIKGNKIFSEKSLLKLFKSNSTNLFSWYKKNDVFISDILESDLDRLRVFYMNNGYADFKVQDQKINFSYNKDMVDILISIDEGSLYKINDIKLLCNSCELYKKVFDIIKIKNGDIYSISNINNTILSIREYLGNFGFALADINFFIETKEAESLIDIIFSVDIGDTVYINKINITGNSYTHDKVIRRELRQLESSIYNHQKIKLSKEKLDRLGFFNKVVMEFNSCPDSNDLVDINIDVEEKPTGIFNIGFGYGSSDKTVFSAMVSDENLFGNGSELTLQLNRSKANSSATISYTDPYFLDKKIKSTIMLDYKINNQHEVGNNCKIKSFKQGFNLEIPISESSALSFGSSIEQNNIISFNKLSSVYNRFVNQYGCNTKSININLGISDDTRDSNVFPRVGSFKGAKLDFSFMDMKYFLITANYQRYLLFADKYIVSINGLIDYGISYGSKDYPSIKNMYAGGIGSVRGYRNSSVGPRDFFTGEYIGGSKRILANAQFYIPLPNESVDKTLRPFLFIDSGRVFNESIKKYNDSIDCGWRYSAGLGVSWKSPVGIMQISYGVPLNRHIDDDIQNLQIQLGTNF
ncbi:outer membrane protein assembly complex YaeT [Candidatus Kinetoplastibacterium oncopeltii TCC290E]|uniref:Outer membrane protein assembly factor BamA n=1 Tax=Candidatus Kinetoplastidibacterium stringomonadis TCC290E TaxID=1208920 RepID=M1LW86_9PROT|nr:outer membrane protein assembly factor BamA [Candidatus Kinetoplastibacterium oncopeltii]AGF48326.1 outer membrane protein assembly complex YaeT [Candidatus Kinetoplastibacterium oncopeltii TCC290E]